jgi:hypothetical protein
MKITGIVAASFLACMLSQTANAQMNQTDIKGVIVKETAPDIEGNPYLFDDWQTGSVTFSNGKTFTILKLKYDIHYDRLLFLTEKGEELNFSDPVEQFSINNETFKKGFPPVDKQTTDSYYKVLADGRTKLLRFSKKVVSEHQTYGTQTTEKSYRQTDYYYIEKDGQMIKIKPDKKSVLAALPDHPVQLEAYINIHHINFKDDQAMGQMITFYNTLQ